MANSSALSIDNDRQTVLDEDEEYISSDDKGYGDDDGDSDREDGLSYEDVMLAIKTALGDEEPQDLRLDYTLGLIEPDPT